MKKLLLFIFLFPLALQGAFTPTNPVEFKGVTVDTSNAYHAPTGGQIYDTNLQPFIICAPLATPIAGDFFLFTDTTSCGVLSKGDIADLLSGACVVIGPGTGGVLPIWLAGACSTTVGDSFQRQLCGDILWDDGVNDIITWDFTTNPTCAIAWTVGDVSGTVMIDNAIAANAIPLKTTTNGEFVSSPLSVTCGNILRNDADADWWFGNDACVTSEAIRFLSGTNQLVIYGGGLTVNMQNNAFSITGIGKSLETLDGDFSIGSANTAQRDFIHHGTTDRVKINAELITAPRAQQWADMDGVIAVWGEEAASILVDFAAQSSGAVVNAQAYEFTVASGASGDFDNVVAGTLNGVISVGTVFTASASAIPTNYDGATIEPVVLVTSPTMRLSSDSVVAADREFKLSTSGVVDGQIVHLEWNHATFKAELLQAGIFKMGADFRPDEFHTLTLRYNGTNFLELSRSANQ